MPAGRGSASGLVTPVLGRPRLEALDGVRGLGALTVVAYHYMYRAPELYPELGFQYTWLHIMQYNINLFYMISGFLIFMTLRRRSVGHFVIARAIRLYPLYWAAIIITFTVVAIAGLPGREVTLGDAIINLTMIQSYVGVPHVDGAYWTLAVELLFYVQCALLLGAGLTGEKALPFVLPAWLGLSALTLIPGVHSSVTPVEEIWHVSAWTPLFIIGVVLYLRWNGETRPTVLMMIPLAIAVIAVRSPGEAFAAALFTAIMWLAVWGPDVGLSTPFAVWLGTISYGLYLLHQNIGYVALRALEPWVDQRVAIVLVFAGAIALASLITYRYDIPVRDALTRRLLPKRLTVKTKAASLDPAMKR